MAKICVIIPAYNQGHYLGEAIESVLKQTYPDFELIVVDDGSTDNTREVTTHILDPRLIYIYQENRGLSAARNTGIRNSSAPYLTFLDSDDLFLPEKLELLSTCLDENPKLGLVAGQAIPIDGHGIPVGKVLDTPLPEDSTKLLEANPLHVGSVMVRRSWQEKVGFFDEALHSYEDWDMWLRLARAGCPMAYTHQPVSLYRFHRAQMTRIGDQMTEATFAVLDKTFSDPNLPDKWISMRNKAYSRANLRAAAQAYHTKDITKAKFHLKEAIRLYPELLTNDGDQLANLIAGWINLPKTNDPLGYLDRVYTNLPECLDILSRHHHQYLGEAAIQIAFSAYQQKDYKMAKNAVIRAFLHQPKLLLNRGALVVFFRSVLRSYL